jgi:hypothetical protein
VVFGPHLGVADFEIFPRKFGEFLLGGFKPRLRRFTPEWSRSI